MVGLALSLGPVVYRTVERIQTVLIAAVLVFLLGIFFLVVEPSHVWDLCKGIVNIGYIPEENGSCRSFWEPWLLLVLAGR